MQLGQRLLSVDDNVLLATLLPHKIVRVMVLEVEEIPISRSLSTEVLKYHYNLW